MPRREIVTFITGFGVLAFGALFHILPDRSMAGDLCGAAAFLVAIGGIWMRLGACPTAQACLDE